MKQLLIISLLFPLMSLTQLTDTTCVKYRWIALEPIEINKDIFLLDSTISDELDLVHTIKRLVEKNRINIYKQNEGPLGLEGWYYIDYQEELENKLKDSLSYWKSDPFFEILVGHDKPMVNMYGEDSITKNGEFIYPAPKVYVFPTRECDEVRIKEERKYNDSTNKFEFVPVGLSFYFNGHKYSRGHEKFWVDLQELFKAIEVKSKYPWYDALTNKNYRGFQYMQVSCYDDVIKN